MSGFGQTRTVNVIDCLPQRRRLLTGWTIYERAHFVFAASLGSY
jgi:hypothetical protein